MKSNQTIFFGALLMLFGCATTDLPSVENGLYINPGYEFSLRIPEEWEVSEKIPEGLKKNMSFFSSQKFKATFSDLKNKSFILISAETTDAYWIDLKMYSDKFIASLDDYFGKEKHKNLKNKDWHYYNYKIYEDEIENCEGSCIATKIDFHVRDLKSTGHNIIYKCNTGKISSVTLILIAREKQFSSSLYNFRMVVNSFQHY